MSWEMVRVVGNNLQEREALVLGAQAARLP